MKRYLLCLLALTLLAGAALAQAPVVDPGWAVFVIRHGDPAGTGGAPSIYESDPVTHAIGITTGVSGQKAALGTNLINGARVSQITSLHIDRLDTPGSLWGPYFNIWVTDGLGHYAVIANEPSNPEWGADRWDVTSWDGLRTKTCKVYETPGAGTNTSWVHTYAGATSLVFEDVAGLIIEAPTPAYIADPLNAVGTGAPDELGTNIAYGFNWMFGDTAANYLNAFVVDNYYATATFSVTNVTQGTHFATIQPAVDAADPNDEISVAAGHYVEQVHITVDGLSITGAGVGATFIDSPVALPMSFTTSDINKAIVFVDHADGVALADLTVDGLGRGNSNYRFQGIGYWNSGGSLTNVNCLNVMDTPFGGAQHGNGIYAIVTDSSPHAFAMTDVLVDGFQKTAVVLAGAGLTADLLRVTATGEGPTAVTAQNGIQVSGGASADVADCDVSGVAYTGASWTATGLLAYGPGVTDFDGCTVDGCQTSVYFIDGSGSFDDSDVVNPLGDAFWVYSFAGAKAMATDRPLPQPFDGEPSGAPNKAAMTVSLAGSTFIGTGLPDSYGPTAWSDEPITFTMDDCEVANWDYGIILYDTGGAVFDATISHCSIHGNTSAGLYSNAAQTAAATCNWWGSTSGPDAPGNPSSGDALSGAATYAPWLDAVNGACVLYGDNNVGVGDAALCLTPANTCVTLPVTFNRLDTTQSRGVSVTFQLSPELVLCTGDPEDDIDTPSGAGTWIGNPTGQWNEIVDNGGGSYTVDRAITGFDCGSDHGGLLFTVDVAKAPGVTSDAVGTVTVTEVVVRDCANAPLLGVPGAPGQVSIDLTMPTALAGLAAAQVKSGNDGDGTTKIKLTWTAPGGDAEFIDLWRKGFGHYPEYDDNGGAVPTGPVTLVNGWTHVVQLAAGAVEYFDEPANRDFWYYAAFVTDGCGNVSAASALTGGTLNYHLGDVMPAGGDNWVTTADISNLGAHYGITLVANDTYNYLDVGRTTDYSVDARPTTDNRIQFEDLLVFAMNFETPSKVFPNLTPADVNAISLVAGTPGAAGSTFDVTIRLSGDGRIQGLSVPLVWDADVATPIDMRAGDFLASQGDLTLVLSPEPGTVDAALMGLREQGIAGEGILATVTFRLDAAGDPRIGLGNVSARDRANRPVVLNGAGATLPPAGLPALSELRANVPNPFNPSTEFSFVLSQSGPVTLRIYTMRGELVRTLLDQDMAAGPHALTWNGSDDQGRQVASGGYIVRFVAPDRTQSRHITLLK